jgi:GT2 family glycosyltransferase
VIPTWNGYDMLEECLGALDHQTLRPSQTIVVDNGSTDGTVERLRVRWPDVEVIALPTNQGFAAGCNRGIDAADPTLDIVLLNNDARPEPTWLAHLQQAARDASPAVGVLSAKLIGTDGLIDSSGDFLTTWGMPFQRGHGEPDEGQYDEHTEVFSACGGASLYRRAMLQELGAFDEAYFAYYEDVDLSFRARLAGWDIRLVPAAIVIHQGGGTSGRIHGFRRYHATRNIWYLIVKNVPAPMLPGFVLRTLIVQSWYLIAAARHRQLGIAMSAHRDAFRAIPRVWAMRAHIQASRQVPLSLVRTWFPRRRAAVRARLPWTSQV